MLLKDIRQHVTEKLDEVDVLKELRDSKRSIYISESEQDISGKNVPLQEIEVKSIPECNTWVFANEFDLEQNKIHGKKKKPIWTGALTSAGKKVEKTIIHYDSEEKRLFLFMIEMKRTLSPKKMCEDVVRKIEQSLITLSVFISAHSKFSELEDVTVYPVGICCFNYYEDDPNYSRDPRRETTPQTVRTAYETSKNFFTCGIEPVTLKRMSIPIFILENPDRSPVLSSFSIDLEDIRHKLKP